MIIDRILDRQEGEPYSPKEFYLYCNGYDEFGNAVARAMDGGTEKDVKHELCRYVIGCRFNPDYALKVCKYINSVEWLR